MKKFSLKRSVSFLTALMVVTSSVAMPTSAADLDNALVSETELAETEI